MAPCNFKSAAAAALVVGLLSIACVVVAGVAVVEGEQLKCQPFEFPVETGTHCVSCTYCSPEDNHHDCVKHCKCETSEKCAPPNGFCAVRDYGGKLGEAMLCESCWDMCNRREGLQRVLPSEEAVPLRPHCPTSCSCASHAECAVGYFCKKLWMAKPGAACARCGDCVDREAVDNKCPRTNCAATMECESHEECAARTGNASSWCSADHICHNCTDMCFAEPQDREMVGYRPGMSITGSCPKACCNWLRGADNPRANWPPPLRLTLSVCEPERHANFAVLWAPPSGDAPHFPPSAAAARAAGWHDCDTHVAELTDGFPRQVTRAVCNWIEKCKREERRVAVFADVDGEPTLLHSWSGSASGYSYECDLGALIMYGAVFCIIFLIIWVYCVARCCRSAWIWWKTRSKRD